MAGDDDDRQTLRLTRWDGTWDSADRDAAFKTEVAEYSRLDPVTTLRGLSEHLGVPVGALARYVLAKWASAGSDGLLEIGPTMVARLRALVTEAERVGTDEARLAAYHTLAGMISWLHAPLDET
ncbi:MAG TPA: DUF6027 family protein [Pseudonocardia sp.]|jgi:hypothetical protein|nr:DUF6027 family protein [Pseudonocardia sp.]